MSRQPSRNELKELDEMEIYPYKALKRSERLCESLGYRTIRYNFIIYIINRLNDETLEYVSKLFNDEV